MGNPKSISQYMVQDFVRQSVVMVPNLYIYISYEGAQRLPAWDVARSLVHIPNMGAESASTCRDYTISLSVSKTVDL